MAFDCSDLTNTSGLRSTNWSKIYYPEYLMVRDRRLIMTENAWVNKVCVGVSHENFGRQNYSSSVYDLAKTHKMKLRSCLANFRRTVGYFEKKIKNYLNELFFYFTKKTKN